MTAVFKMKLNQNFEELSVSVILFLAVSYRMLGICLNVKMVLYL